MGFSEKMRESLGAGGVRLTLRLDDDRPVAPGEQLHATLTVSGGNRAAHIESVVVRIVEADRYWKSPAGEVLSESEGRIDRSGRLTAGWDRQVVGEYSVDLHRDLPAEESFEVHLNSLIPRHCRASDMACTHTLNVQAEVRGQIDPTANTMIRIAPTRPSVQAESVPAEPMGAEPMERESMEAEPMGAEPVEAPEETEPESAQA